MATGLVPVFVACDYYGGADEKDPMKVKQVYYQEGYDPPWVDDLKDAQRFYGQGGWDLAIEAVQENLLPDGNGGPINVVCIDWVKPEDVPPGDTDGETDEE